MMKRRFLMTAALCAALTLTGCISRQAADETLTKGCIAGINEMIGDGLKVGTIKERIFTTSDEGQNFRRVTLRALATDGWFEDEREFSCVFEESFGLFKNNHVAAIYQLRVSEDQIYGKTGGHIVGSAQDFTRLTDAIRKAMYE